MKKSAFYSLLLSLPILAACTQTNAIKTTSTPEPTSTPPPIGQPTRPDHDSLQSMAYTAQQIQSIESGAFVTQEKMLSDWWQYWKNASEENRPFGPDSDPVFAYYWDEGGAPGAALLQPGRGYGSRAFYVPIWNGDYLEVPPTMRTEGYDIPVGMGPLELSGGEWVLAWRGGSWVRLDEGGEVVERVNMQTAQWEEERFLRLLPDSLEMVKENNILRWDRLEEDMELLLEKEKALTADSSLVEPFTTGIPGMDSEKLKAPSTHILRFSNPNGLSFLS